MENRFKIDFFELSFLAGACIPPKPIARTMFWHRLIDKYYYELSKSERARMYEWINREWAMEKGLENKNEDCLLFNARFNPDNQYLVTTNFKGKEEEHECFLWENRYHTKRKTSIQEEFITKVEKIIAN